MKHTFFRPTHAYVPGQNNRHAENAFDAIKNSVHSGQNMEELLSSSAFFTGLDYLDKGYFWEAHEVLEPVWLALPDGCPERKFVQGLIQLANGFLKLKMGMPKASVRLAKISRDLLDARFETRYLTLDLAPFIGKTVQLEELAKNEL